MQYLTDFFSYITNLGVSVMMPLIITVLGLIFKQKLSTSFKAGLTVGIGFIGLSAITNQMLIAIEPVTEKLVDKYNFPLTVTDAGWSIGASMAWGTAVVPIIFLVILAVNAIMIWLNWTKTLNIDIWNYWHAMLPAGIIYLQTHNMLYPILIAITVTFIQLKLADITQKDCEEVLGLEGLSLPHTQANGWSIIAYPVNWLLDRIPKVKDINWNFENIQQRLGFFSEPMIIGLIIGGGLSILAGMKLEEILQTAIVIAASLVLIPKMVQLLMDGLSVLSESAHEFLQKKFPDRQLYIGVDAALGIGHPYVITLGLLMIPVTLLLSFILPGNKVMPIADLTVLTYFMVYSILPSKGNLFRGFITSVIVMAFTLYFASFIAPDYTMLANELGIKSTAGEITSLNVAAGWYNWVAYWIMKFISNLF